MYLFVFDFFLVHSGMLVGAMSILDDYGIRRSLERLYLDHNYSITIVGHSLGAGTAALLAAEFKNGIVKAGMKISGMFGNVCMYHT